ncbi:hypothetical protein LO772_22455 [Yinghuangia sp. ASG 101]|uniref:hypothetical protein n=1 Tax=Yinghuangia sp. ASG 101 TaxID=2896848 RepID=UPI001E4FDE03|nr:hypothetical protein [Yinghuangia sp. ASG 101]UGQ09668.1 hypothetical protein LO772_22455 [Yinghuangia sp. ASG 101]
MKRAVATRRPRPGWSRLRRTRRAAVCWAAALPLMLSACVPGSDAGADANDGARNPTGAPDPAKDLNAKLPPNFLLDKGWSVDETNRVFAVAQYNDLVLDVYALGNSAESARAEDTEASRTATPDASGAPESDASSESSASPSASSAGANSVLIARNAADGNVVWSSAPLRRIVTERPPTLSVVETKRGPYIVVVRAGGLPANGVARAQQLVVADSFPIAATGTDRPPTRHVEHVVDASPSEMLIAVGEGGVLIAGAPSESGGQTPSVIWDPLGGALTPAPAPATRRLPDCTSDDDDCDVREKHLLPTVAGLLFREESVGRSGDEKMRFGVSGRWDSSRVAPPGRTESVILGVTRTAVVAAWRAGEDQPVLYSVHDVNTGEILASAECLGTTPDAADAAQSVFDGDTDAAGLTTKVRVSASGRYLVVNSFVADLSGRTATCFTGDRENRSVTLTSVDDAGIAYGRLLDDDDDVADYASVDTRRGKVDALPVGTSVPVAVTASGVGVFQFADENASDRNSVVVAAPPSGPAPAPAPPP